MAEFYEPMLYLSTPEHPNKMGALVVLKERWMARFFEIPSSAFGKGFRTYM